MMCCKGPKDVFLIPQQLLPATKAKPINTSTEGVCF